MTNEVRGEMENVQILVPSRGFLRSGCIFVKLKWNRTAIWGRCWTGHWRNMLRLIPGRQTAERRNLVSFERN